MGRKRILVVDFEPRRVAATRDWLAGRGYDVVVASSGPELDAILGSRPPAVVLVEPMLPGRDGFALCRALKHGEFGLVPRVILASRLLRGERYKGQARAAGADLFLERPRQDEMLLPAIERCFELGPESTSASAVGVRTTGTGSPAARATVRSGASGQVPAVSAAGSAGPRTSGAPAPRTAPSPAAPRTGSALAAARTTGGGATTATLDISRDISSEDELDQIIDDAFADIASLGGSVLQTGAQGTAADAPSAPEPAPPAAASTGSRQAPSPGPATVSPPAAVEETTGPPPAAEVLAARRTGSVTPAPPVPAVSADPLADLAEELSGPASGAQPLADAVGPSDPSLSGPLSGPTTGSQRGAAARTAAAAQATPQAPTASIPLADKRPVARPPVERSATASRETPAVQAAGPVDSASGRRGLLLAAAVALVTVGLVVGGWTLLSRRNEPVDVTPMRPVAGAPAPVAGTGPVGAGDQVVTTSPRAAGPLAETGTPPAEGLPVPAEPPAETPDRQLAAAPAGKEPPTRPEAASRNVEAIGRRAESGPPAVTDSSRTRVPAGPVKEAAAAPSTPSPKVSLPPPAATAAEPEITPAEQPAGARQAAPARPPVEEPATSRAEGDRAPGQGDGPAPPVPAESDAATEPVEVAATSPAGPEAEPPTSAANDEQAPAAAPSKETAASEPAPAPPSRPEPAVATPPAEKAQSVLVGGAAAAVSPPELIASTRVSPIYPDRARRFRHRCRVTLEVLIDTAGAVREAKVIEETIRGFGFGREAQRAVRQWRYTPARANGRPVEYREKIVINFVP